MAKTPPRVTAEVVSMTRVSDDPTQNPLCAFLTASIAGKITLSELRLLFHDGKFIVEGPQKTFTDKHGRRRHSTLAVFHDPAWRAALNEAAVKAWLEPVSIPETAGVGGQN